MRQYKIRNRLLPLIIALSTIWIAIPVASAQTAVNDNFANAEVLTTNGTWLGTNVGATVEAGEPANAGVPNGASVWFQWTAPADGYLSIDTSGSNFDTTLGLYTGLAVDGLTTIAENDDSIGLESALPNVPVTSGTVYHISVDGYNAATGLITLNWSFWDGADVTPPQVILSTPADGAIFVQNAVVLANYDCQDEPLGSGIATCVGDVPSGDPIDTAGLGPHTFSVTGTDNTGNNADAMATYTIIEALANDHFADAELLATDGTWLGTNIGTTGEPGEPTYGASVWFQWTAPVDGYLTADTFGSDFDTVLFLFTGSAVDELTTVAWSDDSGGAQSLLANVPVTAGTVYHLAVDGYFGSTGQITLTWSFWDGTDTTAPTVTVVTPADGFNFVENAIVAADYFCTDEALGTGVASCIGDVPVGEPIDTAVAGPQIFTVTGTDVAGNVTVATANYTVSGTDATLPTVTIFSPPDGGIVSQNGVLIADYDCSDNEFGTGIATCVGDQPAGGTIDTSVLGPAIFTLTGTDNAGNVAVATASYTVIEVMANDNFATAEVLSGNGTWLGTNIGATRESGEPSHANNPGGASLWFQWTATLDGYLNVDTFGSDFNTVLAMYTGSGVDALTELAANDNSSGLQSKLTNVPVAVGTTYYIAVDGYFGATGSVTLNWSFAEQFDTVPPRVTIWDPVDGIVWPQGYAENAYYTCFDPYPSSGMASCDGDVPVGDPIDTSTPGTFTFTATGTDLAGNTTTATATYTVVGNPPNDDFADAFLLTTDGTTSGTNAGATKETGEPNHHGNVAGTSVWFQWVAPADGFLTVNTFDSDFDTILAMYTGTVLTDLTAVASNGDYLGEQSQLTYVRVTAATTYSIALSGFTYATGNYVMTWSFLELNDLTPPTVTLVAPADGTIFFEGVTVAADYRCDDEFLGSGIASCDGTVPAGDPIDTSVPGPYTFTVTATDNVGHTTVVTSNYMVQALTNDDFANALEITGSNGLIATNIGTSKEAGEPDHAGNPGGASVWFRWTALEDGFFSVDTFDSDFDTTLAVYTGSSVSTLTEFGSNNNSAGFYQSEVYDLFVTAGETYYIAVDGFDGATGQIDLDWSTFAGPVFREITPTLDPLWGTDAEHDFWLNTAAPADVDGDGDLDLAVMGYFVEYNVSVEHKLVIFMNDGPDLDGNWTFTPQELPLIEMYAGNVDIAWGDFDSDGDPDLAVAAEEATAIFRNDDGFLVRLPNELPVYNEDSGYTGTYDLRSLTWADYDNDSDLDLLLPSTFDFDLYEYKTILLRNDGDDGEGGWLFVDSEIQLDATVHAQTAWADDDGDGDLDLFMANVDNFTGNGYVRTYRNDGGVFTSAEPIGSLTVEHGLADWSDYDGDGDLDILVVGNIRETAGNYTTVLRVYDNEAGVYVPNTIIQTSFFPWLDMYAATWADYDQDGDADILLTGTYIGPFNIEGKSVVYVNEDGVFTLLGGHDLPAPVGPVGNGGSFTWFDVDGDGDLDYFVAGAYWVPNGNNSVRAEMHLYRNESLAQNAAPVPPASLSASVDGDTVDLSWDAASDDATSTAAITYDVVVLPQNQTRGALGSRQRLPEPGNVSAVTNWSLRGLAPGNYTWMVQAVDSAFNGSIAAESTFTIGGFVDSDGDGIADSSDNCLNQPNPAQRDTDADGYGNRCDPDLNNDGIVNFIDLEQLKSLFFTSDANADLNGDGAINFLDSAIMSDYFFLAPGPSGFAP